MLVLLSHWPHLILLVGTESEASSSGTSTQTVSYPGCRNTLPKAWRLKQLKFVPSPFCRPAGQNQLSLICFGPRVRGATGRCAFQRLQGRIHPVPLPAASGTAGIPGSVAASLQSLPPHPDHITFSLAVSELPPPPSYKDTCDCMWAPPG